LFTLSLHDALPIHSDSYWFDSIFFWGCVLSVIDVMRLRMHPASIKLLTYATQIEPGGCQWPALSRPDNRLSHSWLGPSRPIMETTLPWSLNFWMIASKVATVDASQISASVRSMTMWSAESV